MVKRQAVLHAADLFCGAGGFTTGAEASGRVKVVLAINHWRTAIYTHQHNHPDIRHLCARIEHVDARNDATLPKLDLILASPECTHHSIARGGRPVCDQTRAQPFALLDWIDAKRPRWLCVENVREFRDWGPLVNKGTNSKPLWRPDPTRKGQTFRAWVQAIEAMGYRVDSQLLNAADYGAHTARTRLFILACRSDVKARTIPWPEPSHSRGQWLPARDIIDWSRPCPSIFSRKRPLAEKTLRRIEMGLKKFVGPFQFKAAGRNPGATNPITSPLPTIVAARQNHAIVVPYLTQFHNGDDGDRRNYSLDNPLPTLDTQNRYGLVAPYLLAINHGGDDDRSRSVHQPLATLTTKTGHSVVMPFLTKYYGTGGVQALEEPLDTVTTKDRFGLAMASLLETMHELHVVDIGFRMLEAAELAAAQGFPVGYYLHGTKADQVRQVGNAVCPPIAEAICRTIADASER
ncbi:MAG: DNA cytosine methyltransferase [Pirellulaceae bacterium]